MIEVERRGCIVVIERGAAWPAFVFERMADREGVVVVTWLPDEPLLCFLARLARSCTFLEDDGISIRSAVLACCADPEAGSEARALVVKTLTNRLARERESHVTLVGDGREGATPTDLVALVDALVRATGTAPIRVQVLSQPAAAQRAAADTVLSQSNAHSRHLDSREAPVALTA